MDDACAWAEAKYGWENMRWWTYVMACRINGRILWGWKISTLDMSWGMAPEATMQGVIGASPRMRLIEPWGKTSWLVWFPGLYANERPPHVKLRNDESESWPDEAMEGASFKLLEPRKSGRAVVREVVGMYVGGDPEAPAHITVHYGERPASDFLLLQEIQQSQAGTLGRIFKI